MILTEKQHLLHDFICRFNLAKGYPPTISDIQKQFKQNSTSTVHKMLAQLEKKGFIRRTPNISRGIEILKNSEQSGLCKIPLLGLIAAGQPIEAILRNDTREVPAEMIRSDKTFALQVSGDSMINEGIFDGDIIVVEPSRTAEKGQMVVALINGSEATLKRFRRAGNTVYLEPANPRYKTIVIKPPSTIEIQGILTGSYRLYNK
jgi:repressor LexA